MDPNLHELVASGATGELQAIIRLSPAGTPPPGVRLVAQFGDIATCRLPAASIEETWADESVVSLKAALPFGQGEIPESAEKVEPPDSWDGGDLRRPPGLAATGQGTIVAVVDWGFDFAHDNFRNDDGSTRIVALWDQSSPFTPTLDPYGYGRVFTRQEINAALASKRPYETLGYHPGKSDPRGVGTHGTHVLDIAAGNGRLRGSICGVAPRADLLLVHAGTPTPRDTDNLGDSVTLLEALDWIRKMAGTTSFAVNMSVGRMGGPHTGLTPAELCIDRLVSESPGRCVVQSAGNYFPAHTHASGQLRPGQQRTLHWNIHSNDKTPNELEIWYPKGDVFLVSLEHPGGGRRIAVPLGGSAAIQQDGATVGRFYHRAHDPSNGDNHVNIFLYVDAAPGEWRVTLKAQDVSDGRFHCWVERDSGCRNCQSRLDPADCDPHSTTGTICNGRKNIAVGGYDAHDPSRKLGKFSSAGPTVDGRIKPDVIAPAVAVWAAKSTPPDSPEPLPGITLNSGTSMAAPHVTGCIANMFQAAGRPLSIGETRLLLLETAEPLQQRDSIDRWRVGSGFLDIEKAVAATERWVKRYPAVRDLTTVEQEEALEELLSDSPDDERVEPDPADDFAIDVLPVTDRTWVNDLRYVASDVPLSWQSSGRAALDEAISQALQLIDSFAFPSPQQYRLRALLHAARSGGLIDDLYIDGNNGNLRQLLREGYPRLTPRGFRHVAATRRMRVDLRILADGTEDVARSLQALDESLMAGLDLVSDDSAGNETEDSLLAQLREFVSVQRDNLASPYAYCAGGE